MRTYSTPSRRTPTRSGWRPALAAGLIALGVVASAGIARAQLPVPDPVPAPTAAPLPGPTPVPAAAVLVPGTPCTVEVRACVDLDTARAWLIDAGTVVRGPVPISSGGPGRETPRGDFRVEWKNKNHRSAEFGGAPMPFAVFFAEGGIAFHEGNLETASAGCVRLARADASAFHDHLMVDDAVQVR